MYFVGIFTSEKSKKYLNKIINNQIKTDEFQIIYLTEKSIENMKNVHFDSIVVNKKFINSDVLKGNLANTKFVIINTDIITNLKFLNKTNCSVINYGFNPKSTVTFSSNTQDKIQICIQRNILNNSINIEQQEISISKTEEVDIYNIMLLICILLIYDSKIINLLKL